MPKNITNTFLFLANFSVFFNVILEGLGFGFFLSEIILRIYNFFFFKVSNKIFIVQDPEDKKDATVFLGLF